MAGRGISGLLGLRTGPDINDPCAVDEAEEVGPGLVEDVVEEVEGCPRVAELPASTADFAGGRPASLTGESSAIAELGRSGMRFAAKAAFFCAAIVSLRAVLAFDVAALGLADDPGPTLLVKEACVAFGLLESFSSS